MTNECPCCRRQVESQPIRPACEFCGYEFRLQPLPDLVRPPRRTGAAVFYTFAGTAVLLGVLQFPELLHRGRALATKAAFKAAARTDGLHQIQPTDSPGREKGLVWGRVWDLKSLAPVPEAAVVFEDAEKRVYHGAITDKDGRYQAWLPVRAEGYYLTIHHPGYARRFTEDWVPSLRHQQPSTRAELARDLVGRPADETHVLPRPQRHFEKDFLLVPLPD